MSPEARTVSFADLDEEVTLVYDADTEMLSVLTGERMVGSMLLAVITPAPPPEFAETEPIIDPDPPEPDPPVNELDAEEKED